MAKIVVYDVESQLIVMNGKKEDKLVKEYEECGWDFEFADRYEFNESAIIGGVLNIDIQE